MPTHVYLYIPIHHRDPHLNLSFFSLRSLLPKRKRQTRLDYVTRYATKTNPTLPSELESAVRYAALCGDMTRVLYVVSRIWLHRTLNASPGEGSLLLLGVADG